MHDDPTSPSHDPHETRPLGSAPGSDDTIEGSESYPDRIGNYTIHGVLGRGGMGVVFEAEQEAPRRPVALKVIRGARYVDELTLKLFRRETELLGRLDHPGIAKIYEAGRTADGEPYFAMELARGRTLAHWAEIGDGARLDRAAIEQRLLVFVRICEAVGFAHRRGVIHRDLKPANVIVGAPDETTGLPAIKVLDFGLARLAENDDPDATAMTQDGQTRGTLAYMSPEQIQGRANSPDVRVDVYALGIVLYEVLTGTRPYDTGASVARAVRAICEEAPGTLRDAWRGPSAPDADLETIVATALAKDPDRRYATVDALADDVTRYLERQPIKARPASTAYVVRMLVRRNPLASALTTVALAMVVGFGAVMLVLYQQSQQNLRRALVAETTAAREARSATRVTDFLVDLFAVADPRGGEGETITAGEILERGAEKTRTALASEPHARARLTDALGEAYFGLGLYERSVELRRELVEWADASDAPLAERFRTRLNLSEALSWEGRSDDARAELAAAATLLTDAGVATDDSLFARVGDQGIAIAVSAGDIEGARELIARYDGTIRRWFPDPSGLRGRYLMTVGNLEDRARNPNGALEHFSEAREQFLALDPPDALRAAECVQNFIGPNLVLERFDEARDAATRAVEELTGILGEEHPRAINARANMAIVAVRTGDRESGGVEMRRALELWEKALGTDSAQYEQAVYNLGYFHLEGGNYEQAIELLERSHRDRTERFGPESMAVTYPAFSLATAYRAVGRLEESLAMAQQSLRIDEKLLGPDHEDVAWDRLEIAQTLRAMRRVEEADSMQARAHAIFEKVRAARGGQ